MSNTISSLYSHQTNNTTSPIFFITSYWSDFILVPLKSRAVVIHALEDRGFLFEADLDEPDSEAGFMTNPGRARLDWALAEGADAAVVELGGNDGLRALDPAGTEANLVAILDKLAAERVPALLTGMLAPPNLGPQYGDQFRAVFERLGERPGLIYDPFFLEGVAGDPKLNQPDRIHPNAEGVQRIVARLLPRMEQLIALIPP